MIATCHQGSLLVFGDEVEDAPPTPTKKQIDAMPYEAMLRKVRCAPLVEPFFRGEVGRHFHATLKTKRHALSDQERASISKRVGF